MLGTTRQAAFQRFGHPVDPRTGTPMSHDVRPDAADRAVGLITCLAEGRWEEVAASPMTGCGNASGAARLAQVGLGAHRGHGRPLRADGREPFAPHPAGDTTTVVVPLTLGRAMASRIRPVRPRRQGRA